MASLLESGREDAGISYSNAIELLRLADLAASRYSGVTLAEISEAFHVHERTAQRRVSTVVQKFPHAVEVHDGEDCRRLWRLREMPVARLRLRGAEELEALEAGPGALQGQARRDLSCALTIAWCIRHARRFRQMTCLPRWSSQ